MAGTTDALHFRRLITHENAPSVPEKEEPYVQRTDINFTILFG